MFLTFVAGIDTVRAIVALETCQARTDVLQYDGFSLPPKEWRVLVGTSLFPGLKVASRFAEGRRPWPTSRARRTQAGEPEAIGPSDTGATVELTNRRFASHRRRARSSPQRANATLLCHETPGINSGDRAVPQGFSPRQPCRPVTRRTWD